MAGGTSGRPSDEAVLNEFRRRHPKRLTAEDIADAFDVEPRTALNYLNPLEEQGKLTLHRDAKPKVWERAEDEPTEPIYNDTVARAERQANATERYGMALVTAATTVAAAIGFILSYYVLTNAIGLTVPALSNENAVRVATWIGFASSIAFGVGAALILGANGWPKLARYRAGGELPDDS